MLSRQAHRLKTRPSRSRQRRSGLIRKITCSPGSKGRPASRCQEPLTARCSSSKTVKIVTSTSAIISLRSRLIIARGAGSLWAPQKAASSSETVKTASASLRASSIDRESVRTAIPSSSLPLPPSSRSRSTCDLAAFASSTRTLPVSSVLPTSPCLTTNGARSMTSLPRMATGPFSPLMSSRPTSSNLSPLSRRLCRRRRRRPTATSRWCHLPPGTARKTLRTLRGRSC
mmetsp:Transcript_36813/g.82987  ORF Transcript_36813/g.82987 Transcript_36813/m.82987 type:complete len:229 (-) Transcript_36813:393-1079(-)